MSGNKSELLAQAKSFTNFFRRFEKAEQVISEIIALEGSIATLKVTREGLVETNEELLNKKDDIINATIDAKEAYDKQAISAEKKFNEQQAQLQEAFNDAKFDHDTNMITLKNEHEQAVKDNEAAIKELSDMKAKLTKDVNSLTKQLDTLKKKAQSI